MYMSPRFSRRNFSEMVLTNVKHSLYIIYVPKNTFFTVNQSSSATHTPAGLMVYEVPEAELSQTAATPSTSWDEPLTQSNKLV